MQSKAKPLHTGHRQRMKDKLIAHGGRFFESYELLEMLLYNVIPYKDTKPIAKKLLIRFGSLDGVFTAPKEELIRVEGVGEQCAEFLTAAGCVMKVGEFTFSERADRIFDDYKRTGEFLADYFTEHEDMNIVLLLLDGSMKMLDMVDIPGVSFGSGGIKPNQFIVPAMKAGAEVAIVAYTHRYGALFPSEADRETGKLLSEELGAVGVMLAEQYIVSGRDYIGIGTGLSLKFSSCPSLQSFIDSKEALENG